MQAVKDQLHVVVDERLFGIPQTEGTTEPFIDSFLRNLGLEHVLETKSRFFRCDVEQLGAVVA